MSFAEPALSRTAARPLVAALFVLAAGCASAGALHQARQAEDLRDYDLAVAQYTKAVRANPADRSARMGLDRSKLRAAEAHYERGRRFGAAGRFDEALVELQLAAELNPGSGDVDRELRATRAALRNKLAVEDNGKTALETLVARTRAAVPASIDIPETKLPETITLGRDATSRQAFELVGRLGALAVLFDPQYQDAPAPASLRHLTVKSALDVLARQTQTFYRMTAPGTITVIPDTPAKRHEYTEEMIQNFYLGNADPKETVEMLRVVADTRAVSFLPNTNTIVVRDTPERLHAVAQLISAIDKARPEVIIDVEIMEVNRNQLREYGLQLASPGSNGIEGSIDANYDSQTLRSLRNLSTADALISGLPALYYRLLKSDANTRTLANPHLRATEGTVATAKFGERVPVPSVTFAPIATGGVNQQPITQFTYENIGVNLDITPRTHANDDVTLTVKMDISSVAGNGYAGLPTFASRQLSTQIRLKDGETNILAGLIRDDERTSLDGVPGLGDVPLLKRLFAKNHSERQETDIVLTLTPHIVRVLDVSEADLMPLKVARDTSAGGDAGFAPILEQPLIVKPDEAAKPKTGLPPGPVIIKKR